MTDTAPLCAACGQFVHELWHDCDLDPCPTTIRQRLDNLDGIGYVVVTDIGHFHAATTSRGAALDEAADMGGRVLTLVFGEIVLVEP